MYIRVILLLIVTRIEEGTETSVANTKGIRTRVWPDTSRSTYRDRGNCEEKKRARISIDFLPREINYRLIYNDICDRSNEQMVGFEALWPCWGDSCKGNAKRSRHTVLRASNVILIEEFEFQMLSTGPVSTDLRYIWWMKFQETRNAALLRPFLPLAYRSPFLTAGHLVTALT